ncbi:transposase family protein [Amycolatopsis sp. NPDC049253]|uniref:transposase family protein n=1 Tax=Amycolatopsis sp. NPDC049253 TaxID=3155274 RepID=UPI0034210A6E
MASILALAAVAVVAGARSFAAIGAWAADAPQHLLALLGARLDPRQGRYVAPDEATVRRVTGRLDGDVLADVIGAWLNRQDRAEPEPEVRRATDSDRGGRQVPGGTFARTGGAGVHLLAAITHEDPIVLGQRQVPPGAGEISWFQPLPDTST